MHNKRRYIIIPFKNGSIIDLPKDEEVKPEDKLRGLPMTEKDIVHKTKEEIEKAKKIVEAFKDAKKQGVGVVSLGNKMIDPPVVKRALKVMELVNRING